MVWYSFNLESRFHRRFVEIHGTPSLCTLLMIDGCQALCAHLLWSKALISCKLIIYTYIFFCFLDTCIAMVYLYELISDVNMVCKDTCFFFETYMILESWHFLQNKQLPLGTQKFQLGNSLGHRGAVETMEATSEGAKQCHADDLFFGGRDVGCGCFLRSGL